MHCFFFFDNTYKFEAIITSANTSIFKQTIILNLDAISQSFFLKGFEICLFYSFNVHIQHKNFNASDIDFEFGNHQILSFYNIPICLVFFMLFSFQNLFLLLLFFNFNHIIHFFIFVNQYQSIIITSYFYC